MSSNHSRTAMVSSSRVWMAVEGSSCIGTSRQSFSPVFTRQFILCLVLIAAYTVWNEEGDHEMAPLHFLERDPFSFSATNI